MPEVETGVRAAPEQPSLSALLGDLAHESSTLVRQEMHLAKTEMTQKGVSAAENVGVVLLGGAIANAGLVVLLLALSYALSAYVPLWASALFFAAAALGVGVWIAQRGLEALGRIHLTPEKTVTTMKANAAWVKEQLP
jgi:hypothetical protein